MASSRRCAQFFVFFLIIVLPALENRFALFTGVSSIGQTKGLLAADLLTNKRYFEDLYRD